MRTFVVLFLSSATFGVAIAVTYWIVAHAETTGTILLGIMAAALTFAAGYAVVAERQADLAGDSEQRQASNDAGEDLGIFTPHSAWPILTAVCVAGTLFGILWSPLVAALGAVAFGLCLWRMGAESARTGAGQ